MARCAAFGLALAACGAKKTLDREALLDPERCASCHPDHYREWSGSMHAYASKDPVFLAMNARGQRETGGALGDFCVKCHAPMALREGATKDGLDVASLPEPLQGVTCTFCHAVEGVEGTHDNPLVLADDLVMRGAIDDPVENDAHRSGYSRLHDRNHIESASLCGSCHDIVTPKGVHIERTFLEWKESLFAREDLVGARQTCGSCHMQGRSGIAADYEGVFQRPVHDHSMAALDVALTEFPERDRQRALVERDLSSTVFAELCVQRAVGGVRVDLTLENFAAGHSWPSGAAQDRRAWVELVAYFRGEVVFSSGRLEEGRPLAALEAEDPNLWRLGDRLLDENDREVHMFWEAASVETELLGAPTAASPLDPKYRDRHVTRTYRMSGAVDRITTRILVRPIGLDVLDDLIESGDLDPAHRGAMPTFVLGATVLEWTPDVVDACIPPS